MSALGARLSVGFGIVGTTERLGVEGYSFSSLSEGGGFVAPWSELCGFAR